jgi:hypothetical protein
VRINGVIIISDNNLQSLKNKIANFFKSNHITNWELCEFRCKNNCQHENIEAKENFKGSLQEKNKKIDIIFKKENYKYIVYIVHPEIHEMKMIFKNNPLNLETVKFIIDKIIENSYNPINLNSDNFRIGINRNCDFKHNEIRKILNCYINCMKRERNNELILTQESYTSDEKNIRIH